MTSEIAFLSDPNFCNRETFFRTLFIANMDGVALLDTDERLIDINPAFAAMFDLHAEKILQVRWVELFQQLVSSDEYLSATSIQPISLSEIVSGQDASVGMEREFFVHGRLYVLELKITPFTLDSQQYFLVIVRDVTTAREHTRSKASFLSMIAHELRSPLNALNGYLDLVLAGVGGELNEQQQEFIQRARSGSEHLYTLLENCVLVSRMDASQLRLKREVVYLPEIIKNAVEEFDLTAADYKIAIRVELKGEQLRMYADAVRLQQVLRNLISNALNYTPAGGQIIIAAALVEQPVEAPVFPVAEHTLLTEGGQQRTEAEGQGQQFIRLQVRDTGCGIAAIYHERIFERFFQVSEASIQHTGGVGLGLSVVKAIVELHSGKVVVESERGRGSTFTCVFPVLLA